MKALVVFDSFFGNTERVARAIGDALSTAYDVEVARVSDLADGSLSGVGVLIVGSPTRAFRATPAIRRFVKRIPRGGLDGVTVGAFDTRIDIVKVSSRILNLLVRWFGYAAEPTGATLVARGGRAHAPPAGFIVEDSEGPLREGELERAATWVAQVVGRESL